MTYYIETNVSVLMLMFMIKLFCKIFELGFGDMLETNI